MAKEQNKAGSDLLPGGITKEDLEKFFTAHGKANVRQISVPTDDKEQNFATGYFRKPNMADIAACSPYVNDPVQMGQILMNRCYLAGDPEIKNDDETMLSTIIALNSLFKQRKAVIKNF